MMNVHIFSLAGCGKCQIILSTLFSDLSHYGVKNIQFTDTPQLCDLLVIVGVLTKTQIKPLMNFWKEMPKSHRILSLGNCGTEAQDLFNFKVNHKNQAIPYDDISEIVPVDFIVEGCPPTIEELTGFFKSI